MLLNFKPRFVPMILNHSKRHTIRAKRKIAPRAGEICHCYTGLRRKGAKLLGRWPCVRVQDIYIGRDIDPDIVYVAIDDTFLTRDEREAFARSDGFASFAEMVEFWEGRLPFQGDIIHWDPTATGHPKTGKRAKSLKPTTKKTTGRPS